MRLAPAELQVTNTAGCQPLLIITARAGLETAALYTYGTVLSTSTSASLSLARLPPELPVSNMSSAAADTIPHTPATMHDPAHYRTAARLRSDAHAGQKQHCALVRISVSCCTDAGMHARCRPASAPRRFVSRPGAGRHASQAVPPLQSIANAVHRTPPSYSYTR